MTTDKPPRKTSGFHWLSFKFAFCGIATLFRTAPNARVHAAAALLAIIAGVILKLSAIEWCMITLCIGAVISAEAVNSAVEFLADRVSVERHPLIRQAKDVAAAAVLILALAAVVIGALIFIPKICTLFL